MMLTALSPGSSFDNGCRSKRRAVPPTGLLVVRAGDMGQGALTESDRM